MIFYNTKKIAEMMNVTEVTVRRWIKKGNLKAMKTSANDQGRYKIRKEDFEKFLDERSTKEVK